MRSMPVLENINNLPQNDLLKIVTKIGKKINQVNLLKAALCFFEANMDNLPSKWVLEMHEYMP